MPSLKCYRPRRASSGRADCKCRWHSQTGVAWFSECWPADGIAAAAQKEGLRHVLLAARGL